LHTKQQRKKQKPLTMKKFIYMSAMVLATTFTSLSSVHAQSASPVVNTMSVSVSKVLKSLYASPIEEANAADVNAKALKSFNKNFKVNVPVKWWSDDKSFHAYFVQDGVQHRVTYRKNGQWLLTMKTYAAQYLNDDVKNQVERAYDGYEVMGVTEVNMGVNDVYFVNIQSAKKLKELAVYDGEISVRKEFNLQ
jgi:hypothetical protein